VSKSQALYERNMELQKALAEIASLEEQRSHWLQQALSKSELIAALEAENARLNMEMVAYREKLTLKDAEAMIAVINALTAEKAARGTKS